MQHARRPHLDVGGVLLLAAEQAGLCDRRARELDNQGRTAEANYSRLAAATLRAFATMITARLALEACDDTPPVERGRAVPMEAFRSGLFAPDDDTEPSVIAPELR